MPKTCYVSRSCLKQQFFGSCSCKTSWQERRESTDNSTLKKGESCDQTIFSCPVTKSCDNIKCFRKDL